MQPPPDEIAWHEGMLLEPEHFTDTALRGQRLLGRLATGLHPYPWGLRILKLDQSQLTAGVLQVIEVEALMPDGLHLWRRNVHPPELRLDLTDEGVVGLASDGILTVHLAVPSDVGSSGNLQGLLPRLVSVNPPARPNTSQASESPEIPRLQPNVRLVPGEVPPANHTSFPLLKVRLRDNLFLPDEEYVPPLLHSVLADSVPPLDRPLRTLWGHIAVRLREKVTVLISENRGRAGRWGPDRAPEPASGWARPHPLTSLVAGLPELEGLLEAPTLHPFEIYRCLCRLLGHLCPFAEDGQPPRPDAYDHNSLLAVFSSLVAQINTLMLLAVPDTHTAIPFELFAEGFRLHFRPEWRRSKLLIGLRRRADRDLKELSAWMRSAVLCAGSKLEDAKRQRVTGAPHAPFAGDAHIAPTSDRLLFHCSAEAPWVQEDEPLVLVNPGDAGQPPAPLEAVLYVRK
ncbi:MAG: type VI secretion system baseplate subunit TssK [Verrucomicrobiales bacterium]|nr:type VI secretion system baseplate subunit TssK [Verrucomicrobiales bacterium]